MLQSEMQSHSYLLRHRDQHNRQTNPTCVRHLEFDRVQSLRTSPNLRPITHHEKRVSRWHWSALRWQDRSDPVEMARIGKEMKRRDQATECVVKSFSCSSL